MAFTVQSDDGDVADANAYIEVAYFTAYHTERAVDAVTNGEYSDEQIKAAIVRATDYIDNRWRFKGISVEDSTTEFPREDLYNFNGNLVEGLPTKLKRACAEYALRALSSTGVSPIAPDPETDDRGQSVLSKTEKVGPLEESTTYTSGTVAKFKPYPEADQLLREYIMSTSRVIR